MAAMKIYPGMWRLTLLVVLSAWLTRHLASGACAADVSFGVPPSTVSSDGQTGSGYLMELYRYQVPTTCTCGVLKRWSFSAVQAGTVDFHVWRRMDNNIYQIVGENTFSIPSGAIGTTVTLEVEPANWITVRSGDYLGWYTAGQNVVGHGDGTVFLPDGTKRATMSDLGKSATYNWNAASATILYNTLFSIQATVGPNTAPGFTNLPRSSIIYQDAVVLTQLYVTSVSDIDTDDVSSLYVVSQTEPYLYNFTSATKAITLAQTQPVVGTTTVTLAVHDQCGNSNTGTFTTEVRNLALSLSSQIDFATVIETLTEETLLHTVTASDDVDTTFTETNTITPDESNLEFRQVASNGYGLFSKRTAAYVYRTTQHYETKITVSDGTDSQFGYVDVFVNKNDAPVFTNLDKGARSYVSFQTTKAGDIVYSVAATDAENDPLTFGMTCTPACPFTMNDYGVITANTDLIRVYEPGYDIVITLQDPLTTVQSKTLTVLVEDINDRPTLTNLPLTDPLVVYEDTALGTTIFVVKYFDLDAADVISLRAEYNPGDGDNYFNLDSTTGAVTTASNIIDKEDIPSSSYILTIMASDGQDSATASFTVQIGNVNEAPSFHQTRYTLEPAETGSSGAAAGTPGFVVYDPDAGDTKSYTWDCGTFSRYFVMDRTSTVVSYSADFDLDTSGLSSSTFDCTVTVTDREGLTGTTTLEVDIVDSNTYTPTFTQTKDYLFAVPSLTPGRFVGQVAAVDRDFSATYNRVYYSLNLLPLTDSFLYINQYGNIYVNETWDDTNFYYGRIHVFTIRAEDIGALWSTATVSLVLAATTTEEPVTTDRPRGFLGDTRNVAWVIPTSLLGVLLLATSCGLLVVYSVSQKQFRWLPPCIRKRVTMVAKVVRRLKKAKYRDILEQEKADYYSDSSSSSSSSSSDSEDERIKMQKNKLQNINLVKQSTPPLAKKPPVKKTSKWV